MGRKVIIKLDEELLEAARKKFPELRRVSNVDIVRIIFDKVLSEEQKEGDPHG